MGDNDVVADGWKGMIPSGVSSLDRGLFLLRRCCAHCVHSFEQGDDVDAAAPEFWPVVGMGSFHGHAVGELKWHPSVGNF